CALHLRGKNAGACEARSAEIGLHQPSLIEDCPVEFCIAKVGLVEPRATQNGTRKIEAGEIEARELLAREIGRLKGCCGSHGSLYVRPRHFRRCHLRRRQIDVLHHTLGGCRNGGREAEHSDRTDPDRRAYHRLALPRRLPSLNGRCSDDKRPNALSPRGYARAHLYDHVLATVAAMRARHLSRSIERITWFLAKCMPGRCNQRKTGDDAFTRPGTVGLGAGGGRCGAVYGRRCRGPRS